MYFGFHAYECPGTSINKKKFIAVRNLYFSPCFREVAVIYLCQRVTPHIRVN
jgi:hypothetical protein